MMTMGYDSDVKQAVRKTYSGRLATISLPELGFTRHLQEKSTYLIPIKFSVKTYFGNVWFHGRGARETGRIGAVNSYSPIRPR
jgi:hypothetical protein